MSTASLVLFVTVCSVLLAGCLAKPTSRILDGEEADTVSFPYMVSVRLDGAHICGGSIVASKFIVTAAHCVSQLSVIPVDANRVTIRAGSINQYAGGKLYSVAKIDINSGYNSFLNDVAVLELQTELVLGPRVQIIALADSNEAVAAGDAVTVAGWGNTVSEGAFAYKLHFDTAVVLSQTECDESIGYGLASTLCLKSAAQKGSCFGDAGGPAVFNDKLVGVSNFVIGACGTNYPDVFAKVSYFSSFINSIINPA